MEEAEGTETMSDQEDAMEVTGQAESQEKNVTVTRDFRGAGAMDHQDTVSTTVRSAISAEICTVRNFMGRELCRGREDEDDAESREIEEDDAYERE